MQQIVVRVFPILIVVSIMVFGACSESNSPTDPKDPVVEAVFTSTGEGTLTSADGAEVGIHLGSISTAGDGSNAELTFKIQSNIDRSAISTPIPSMYELVGTIQLFEPMNFVFTDPVQIFLSAANTDSPEDLTILWYNGKSAEWIPLPLNALDEDNKRLGSSVFELGYFAVAKMTAPASGKKLLSSDRVGGMRYRHSHTSDYYYTLTIAAVTYANPAIGWPNLVGYTASTGNRLGGVGPLSTTSMGNIPRGSYTVYISRVKRGTHFNLPGERETYTVPSIVEVGSFSNISSWKMENWHGWTDVGLAGGGEWRKGTPANWPDATVPPAAGTDPLNGKWNIRMKYTTPPYGEDGDVVRVFVKSPSTLEITVYNSDGTVWDTFDRNMSRSKDLRTVHLWIPEKDGEYWKMDFTFVDAGMNRFEGEVQERWYDLDENGNKIWIDERADIVGTRMTGVTGPTQHGNESLSRIFRDTSRSISRLFSR